MNSTQYLQAPATIELSTCIDIDLLSREKLDTYEYHSY